MTQAGTISEARRQLLEKFRRGELQAPKHSLEPLISRASGTQIPLSADLKPVWFLDQLSGGAPVNNESYTIHKRGPLDPPVLERCFNEIARRHEIWRSAFPMIEGKAIQRIDANIRVSMPLTDLSHLPGDERAAESVRCATEDARRPFDLNVAPLLRVRLIRWSQNYHRIYLTVHRLVFDCASIEHVLIGELAALYDAYSAGQPSPLPELALQYRDYSAWMERQNSGARQAGQMEYWRENLSGYRPAFEFPSGLARPTQPTWRSEMETSILPLQLMQSIQEFARREGATPYMILLAALQILLQRECGQNEIIIGGKTNTRTRPEFESLIGSFVNTVVFRTPGAAELSFREFLERVKNTVLGALAHSEIPFDDVMSELEPQREWNRHPLFQVLFSMRAPLAGFPDGWEITDMEVHSGASCYDLFIEFSEQPQGLIGRFVYSTDLFDRATMQRLQRDFQAFLQELVSNTELDSKALAALPPREAIPPQDEIEERLLNLWIELLPSSSMGVTDNYFDLGGTSFLALRLFSEIKFCFGLDLPLATLFYAPTVRTLAPMIRESGVQAASAVVPIQPNGAKPAILCIGPVNGEVILFRPLALELGQDQPLYGLQPFQLAGRLSTVQTLAASYVEQLQQRGERQPFCLLGYSFGGLVALEMARQLGENGAEPPLVVLIDTGYLAGCKALEPWRDRMRRYRHHVNKVIREAGGLHYLAERLQSLAFRIIHRLSTKMRVELPEIASDITGKQRLAAESYRAKPYPGPVLLLKAESRPVFFGNDPKLGWGEILSNLRIEEVPGDHGTMNTGNNVKILAKKLRAFLQDAQPIPCDPAKR
jgi:thioesterase domain-containing protein